MEDIRKAYKGIKFLKVDKQFLGAQLRRTSSKALSINGNLTFVSKTPKSIRSAKNRQNKISKSIVKSSENSIAKSVVKSSENSIAKSSIKNTGISVATKSLFKNAHNDDHYINFKKRKSKKKDSKFKEIEILKQLIEIKKEEENIIHENPNINIKEKSNKLINKSLSSKNLEQLKNKIISFKSIIMNNINNEDKTNKENNINNNEENKIIKNNDNNKCENNIVIYKSENTVKKDNLKKKIKKFFCCL